WQPFTHLSLSVLGLVWRFFLNCSFILLDFVLSTRNLGHNFYYSVCARRVTAKCLKVTGSPYHSFDKMNLVVWNRLCVSVLAVDRFGDGGEGCYGIFDGDRNEEVPRLLQLYMCNTFLTSHSLTVANVGTCQAILCRDGRPVQLSKVFNSIRKDVMQCFFVTCCSRLLGCSYLSPWVLPKPWVRTELLCAKDEFLILGNRALFEQVSYQEAVHTVQAVRDPHAAAKKLCSLAQSYGCKDNIGAVVVSLQSARHSRTLQTF
uniref:PPM-type phosphatase domain-containing protein n=1 Tax=Xiphophorus couchianus TaxID=32473 RepID=A0A3B5LV21_9TELE